MRLRIELPDKGVDAEATLYAQAAPTTAAKVFDALATPLETYTSHACFSGHQVFCFLPPFESKPPLENRTMRSQPGEIMFFHAGPNELALMGDDRLTGGSDAMYEFALNYGEVDLRYFAEEGLHGSLIGRVDKGFEALARACAQTLVEGRTPLRLSQA